LEETLYFFAIFFTHFAILHIKDVNIEERSRKMCILYKQTTKEFVHFDTKTKRSDLITDIRLTSELTNAEAKELLKKCTKKLKGFQITQIESFQAKEPAAAADGTCDIGMASRELKDSETGEGLTAIVIAMDGIAVIVNKNNPATDLTTDQVKSIFTGEAATWADVK